MTVNEDLFELSVVRRLIAIIEINYKLVNKTGLLIRSPIAKVTIGGKDTETMIATKKYIVNNKEHYIDVPYIPGSSIKGRIRSLLELYMGIPLCFDGKILMHRREYPPSKCDSLEYELDDLFGFPSFQLSKLLKDIKEEKDVENKKKKHEYLKKFINIVAPTRLMVEDIFPSNDYVKELLSVNDFISKEDFLEEKSENRIDRITSAADPRFIMRIKPDIEFEGKMKILIFDVDIQKSDNGKTRLERYLDLLFTGMKLVEDTYLGGSGTRGYGKVEFRDIKITLKTPGYYLGKQKPIEIKKLSSPKDYGVNREDIINEIMNALREQK